tara:strand:+ start:67451 stop:68299 length:849 start_codon:yes stop_codon:yes gene_type:complete
MNTCFAQDLSKVKIERVKLTNNIHMLKGAGGNIGVFSGPDGVFLIDDQFAPLTTKIKNAVKLISSRPIKYVFNTHWHYDHTGGNEKHGKSGSIIVAHENVRKLLSEDQFIKVFKKEVKAQPKEGLPVITFNSKINFHLNGDHLEIFHVENAHTNGDSIIHFRKANVFHMGDTLFNSFYPFVDVQHGGSLKGIIKAIDLVLKKSNESTKYIPGHGEIASNADLKNYVGELKNIEKKLLSLKKKGYSLKKVLGMKPLKSYDDKGWGSFFINSQKFIEINYPVIK